MMAKLIKPDGTLSELPSRPSMANSPTTQPLSTEALERISSLNANEMSQLIEEFEGRVNGWRNEHAQVLSRARRKK